MSGIGKPSIAGRLGAGAAIRLAVVAMLLVMPAVYADVPLEKANVATRAADAEVRLRLTGTWKLIAIRDRDPATGKETPAARAADDGQLVYAPNGRLSVQIARKGRESAPKGSADGFSSYFGRWELLPAEGCVVHHQDGNLNYAQTGQAAKRYYSFDAEGHLSLATPPAKRDDGHVMSTVFVWEKIP